MITVLVYNSTFYSSIGQGRQKHKNNYKSKLMGTEYIRKYFVTLITWGVGGGVLKGGVELSYVIEGQLLSV